MSQLSDHTVLMCPASQPPRAVLRCNAIWGVERGSGLVEYQDPHDLSPYLLFYPEFPDAVMRAGLGGKRFGNKAKRYQRTATLAGWLGLALACESMGRQRIDTDC